MIRTVLLYCKGGWEVLICGGSAVSGGEVTSTSAKFRHRVLVLFFSTMSEGAGSSVFLTASSATSTFSSLSTEGATLVMSLHNQSCFGARLEKGHSLALSSLVALLSPRN